MFCSVEVDDSPAVVADDEEAVEKTERRSGHGEEIHGCNRLTMVLQKCQPEFGWVSPPLEPSQIARDRTFANLESQFQEFPMNPRSTPSGILDCHPSDQFLNFQREFRSAGPVTTKHSPIQTKASTLPADYGIGFHDQQRISPP